MFPPLVMKLNFSFMSESSETFTLLTPRSDNVFEYFFNCVPFVVSKISSITFLLSFLDRNSVYSTISFLTNGSPPVIRNFLIHKSMSDSEINLSLLISKISSFL